MPRSALPGLAIAIAGADCGPAARLHGRALSGVARRSRACAGRQNSAAAIRRRAGGGAKRDPAGARAARAGSRAGRRGAGGRRHRFPGPVPQSAGVARYSRRLVRVRRSAPCWAFIFRSASSPSRPSLSSEACSRSPPFIVIGSAVRSRDPILRAGADRRGGRRAARRRRRLGEISRRSLQPASRHDLLAARQPRRRQAYPICCRCSARSPSARSVLIALRWRMNVMSLPEEEARALGLSDRTAARRHRGGGNAGDLGERRHRRHHRLGRAGGAASRARAGRARFRAAACRPRRSSAAAICC